MPIDSIYDYANRLKTLQWAPTKLEPEESLKEASQRAKRAVSVSASRTTHHTQHTHKKKRRSPNPTQETSKNNKRVSSPQRQHIDAERYMRIGSYEKYERKSEAVQWQKTGLPPKVLITWRGLATANRCKAEDGASRPSRLGGRRNSNKQHANVPTPFE